MNIFKEIWLKETHLATNRALHLKPNGAASYPVALQIVEYKSDFGFFLLHLDEEGEVIADTFHLSIEDALRQAQFEFDVMPDEWRTMTQ